MTIALFLDDGLDAIDLDAAGGLKDDKTLQTAITLSLFTDARAPKHLSLEPDERRGFMGSELGSRLWLFFREPLTTGTVAGIRQAAEDCLAWLVEDKVAKAVTVEAIRLSRTRVRLAVTVERSDALPWRGVWEATAAGVQPGAH